MPVPRQYWCGETAYKFGLSTLCWTLHFSTLVLCWHNVADPMLVSSILRCTWLPRGWQLSGGSLMPRCIDQEVKPILRSDEEKELVWRCREEQRKQIFKNFLKALLKMPSIFYEFGCYNKKLCVNKPISIFFITLTQMLIKKWHTNN